MTTMLQEKLTEILGDCFECPYAEHCMEKDNHCRLAEDKMMLESNDAGRTSG